MKLVSGLKWLRSQTILDNLKSLNLTKNEDASITGDKCDPEAAALVIL